MIKNIQKNWKRERERERERETETETETETERDRDRDRDRERDRQRQRERQRETHRETERDRERQRETERETGINKPQTAQALIYFKIPHIYIYIYIITFDILQLFTFSNLLRKWLVSIEKCCIIAHLYKTDTWSKLWMLLHIRVKL